MYKYVTLWAGVNAAACAGAFYLSAVPGGSGGPNVPAVAFVLESALTLAVVSVCVVAPVAALLSGYACILSYAGSRRGWLAAWTAASSLSLVIEVVFLLRLCRFLSSGRELGPQAWHAIYYGAGFLLVGAAMTAIIMLAAKPGTRAPAARATSRSGGYAPLGQKKGP